MKLDIDFLKPKPMGLLAFIFVSVGMAILCAVLLVCAMIYF